LARSSRGSDPSSDIIAAKLSGVDGAEIWRRILDFDRVMRVPQAGRLPGRVSNSPHLSDVIRDELRGAGLDETRERMIEAGARIRQERGPGGLAAVLAERLLPDRNYVIDSVRHPAEVEVLRTRTSRFQLWWVEADENVRLTRMIARGRGGDPRTLDELRALEGRELGGADPAAPQLLAVQALADQTLRNDGTVAELHALSAN
jgi:hypothetical protein